MVISSKLQMLISIFSFFQVFEMLDMNNDHVVNKTDLDTVVDAVSIFNNPISIHLNPLTSHTAYMCSSFNPLITIGM